MIDPFESAHHKLQGDFFSVGYFDIPNMTLMDGVLRHVDKLAELAGIKSTDRVLDVGAGRGVVSQRLAARTGCLVTPVDIVEAPGVTVADKNALPFADNSFDVYWSTLTWSYPDPNITTVSEARRVLRPGGTLAITDIRQDKPVIKRFDNVSVLDWTEHALESYRIMRRADGLTREEHIILRHYFDRLRMGTLSFWCAVAT